MIGDHFRTASGCVYRVDSLSGPDSQYPIVLRMVRMSEEVLQDLLRSWDVNVSIHDDVSQAEYIASYEAHPMHVEQAWFRRTDVRKVEVAA